MSDTENLEDSGDQELIREFLTESLEALGDIDGLFVQLEQRPDDISTVDRIFRPIHSIKGNSSFFGLVNIKNFSHSMENILQEIRSKKRMVTEEIIDVLLRGVDLLREMIERFAGGDFSKEYTPAESECLEKFTMLLASSGGDIATVARQARSLMHELLELAADNPLLEKVRAVNELVQELTVHIAPKAPAEGAGEGVSYSICKTDVTADLLTVIAFVDEVGTASNDQARVEAFLAALSGLRGAASGSEIPSLIEALGSLYSDFTTIQSSGIGFDELMSSLLRERIESAMSSIDVVEDSSKTSAAPAAATEEKKTEPQDAPQEPKKEAKPVAKEGGESAAGMPGKTLRIDEEKVDNFMSYVGELIIASEVFAYLQKKFEKFPQVRDISQEFKNANISFNELSTNLQKSLMAVRRIPLRTIMQKMPRLVRDVSSSTGKQAKLILEGEDVQVDKSLLEGLENPLVHMVRNSVDHGLEDPETRIAAGKDEVGTVWLSATADEETFRLSIRDDGGGLDLEAIRNKAIEKGTISEDKARTMSDSETALLIFGAGVSTARKVTDVSGRGVGMDVVRTNIERLGGTITIDTVRGKGTTFTITLPMTVTLMVVDGLVAKVANDFYIIPVADVRESVRPVAGQVSTVTGRGEVIDVRGELYRLTRLYEILGLTPSSTKPEDSTVIIAESRNSTFGVMVDEVVGQQSLVLKDLGRQFNALEFLQGGAVMGDGRIALVLDTEGLVASSMR